MTSVLRNSTVSQRKTPKKSRKLASSGKRRRGAHANHIDINNGGGRVSEKLEALKNLIPSQKEEEAVKPEELFQETADYIVMLRTQVFVLQKLIEFYGSTEIQSNNAAVSLLQ